MTPDALNTIGVTLAHAGGAGGAAHAGDAVAHAAAGVHASQWLLLIPILPFAGALLCLLYRSLGVRSKLPAWTSIALLAAAFVLTVWAYLTVAPEGGVAIVHGYDWLRMSWGDGPGQTLLASFGLYIDSLTVFWMLFVTGLATLIALYSSEYMADDLKIGHYPRYFAAFCLFVFSMSCLVMGDNLLLLFLGWEGVGLCSYLLIGYHYQRPSAVEAAKKAFIVNRIGDLGLVVGIMLAFVQFGSLEYSVIFEKVAALKADVDAGGHVPATVYWIPILLMIGAFGKSAQLPLYVWLPDAMEGPTPVSALIHAATMVTAGVYLIARFLPIFALNPDALTIVAWVGGLTALLAATIGMAVYDIKRVMAYSTVSQLGYMFLGLGVLTSAGAAYHVFTHAFFKAALFLACGAVMHGFAGQLDLRKLSGVRRMRGWKVTAIAMLVGCLCLAGFPLTSGFFSKDMIIAEAFVTQGPGYAALGWIALLTAGMTAYYAFRAYFRVFEGPVQYEPGDEHHADAHDGHDDHAGHAHGAHGAHGHGDFHPHAPGPAINFVLGALAVGALLAAVPYFMNAEHHGWVGGLMHNSTAHVDASPFAAHGHGAGEEAAHGSFLGFDPHAVMYYVSGAIAALGIFLAWALHLRGRKDAAHAPADALKKRLGVIGVAAENKWYVDEVYDAIIRIPLWVLSSIFYLFDKLIIDGIVDLFGWTPKGFGKSVRPTQSGLLQGYAVGMAAGLAILLLVGWFVVAGPDLSFIFGGGDAAQAAAPGGGH